MNRPGERLDTLQQVELVDGVEVELRIAGPYARGRAWALDMLIKLGMLILVSILLALMDGVVEGLSSGLGYLALFLIFFGYHVILEAGERGATWGKRSLGLKVVTLSGGRIGWGRSALRNFLRMADMMPLFTFAMLPVPSFALGLVFCLFTKRFQRVGDLVAGTVVVYRKAYRRPVSMDFQDQGAEQPPRALRRDEQKALLEFLERGPQWSDARKVELSDHLSALTGSQGLVGAQKLIRMGRWIQGEEGGRSR